MFSYIFIYIFILFESQQSKPVKMISDNGTVQNILKRTLEAIYNETDYTYDNDQDRKRCRVECKKKKQMKIRVFY